MELLFSIIGLILSFFFAGSETAYISTNRFRVDIWLRKNVKSAVLAHKYFQKPDIYLSTTLVGNNVANIITTSYATIYLINYWSETITFLFITFIILLIGEIIPKVLFRSYAHNIILKIMFLIRFFHFILNPLIILASKISSIVIRFLHISDQNEISIINKEDIMVMLHEARISGAVDDEEQKIISRVLNLPDILVREAMIPRTSIHAIDETVSLEDIRHLMAETGKSKIPVYKSNIDNIIGVVFMYDLFWEINDLKEVIKPVMYVPENKKCNELLRELREAASTIAVIIDEYGGTAGIVTIEDLVEELFGEIVESIDKSDKPIIRINQITWKIRASESIEIVNDQLGIKIPDGEYETIGGFILFALGRIPKVGEKISFKDGIITVRRSTKKRIEEVRLVKKT
jgi:putative hemolysin